MKISEAIFSGSSIRVAGKPSEKLPEFAFIGRSNVGKSSLINALCNNRKLAMTSATPGKTKLVNHFRINGEWYLVDLPGYGYAKMPLKEKEKLQEVIKDYLNNSEELVILFVLVDARHDPQKVDLDFMNELVDNEIPFGIIFTKGDKLGPVALKKQTDRYKNILLEDWAGLPPCFVSSAESGLGKEEILDFIQQTLNKLI
ncbi:MAG: YihA family ribosome biogenesis GTP-binding protein [Bacteroidales bacterium]|jgi:GTP-binding protein|nr:YihA family ribosome biogenesis GTP-binding protein [Bacteroidales bacterium]MEE3406514.1 ribosome biogenesis GTP-binding protein YihA/YsxC [Candidatus Cryptobacteroides sp.]SKC49796.1 GTP-binding protein [Bacteroidales bacterium WCE2008]MBO7366074.1 YihA family ribosome biogenesis GTP-binding protein [Bacteroidales bacterium]MBO7622965.1 YihA family ribosome biogenesis GTP-binding protein [Bacteroidales bacterium]